ncbi:MAG: hypothetical protein ACM31C_27360 [Acidobacteriota bacterium]
MAKRSPILGYNHNVRYRGLVFHVQTEDSGVLSPHLFTHLFYEGVIVSTRKLVYDAGANEEAIKSLMQAQHKAVMKDLRRGAFDDKIDQYLGGTPGLEPSASAPAGAEPAKKGERANTDMMPVAELPEADIASIPLETLPAGDASVPIELTVPKASRTQTPQKVSPPVIAPPAPTDDAPTYSDNSGAVAAAIAAANAAASGAPTGQRAATPPVRMSTPLPILPGDEPSSPEIEIVADQGSSRARAPRDTEVSSPEITIPVVMPPEAVPARAKGDSSSPVRHTPTGDRPASHGAAALPPMARPNAPRPSITPPTVVSRPLADGKIRKPGDDSESQPIEIYSPATPSVEPPPGERAERPGQYSVSRAKPPSDNVPMKEKTGRIAVLSPPIGTPRPSATPPPVRIAPPSPPNNRVVTPPAGVAARPKTPTPQRNATAPIRSAPSNVVMTRPAVIVGAPPKAAAPAAQRVRKAREDEGRGFGQGLISEKSLDEVILAYLSEDAEEK